MMRERSWSAPVRAASAPCLLLTVLLLAGALRAAPLSSPASGSAAPGRRCFLVLVPTLTYEEARLATGMPNLRWWQARGALGLMNTRAIPSRFPPREAERVTADPYRGSAYLTLGAGTRCVGGLLSGQAFGPEEPVERGTGAELYHRRNLRTPGPAALLQVNPLQLLELNTGIGYTARPGVLGSLLRSGGLQAVSLGDADRPGEPHREGALVAMDEQGRVGRAPLRSAPPARYAPQAPFGLRSSLPALLHDLDRALAAGVSLTIIDWGDAARLDDYRRWMTDDAYLRARARMLGDLDRLLGALRRRLRPKGDLLILLSPHPGRESRRGFDLLAPILLSPADALADPKQGETSHHQDTKTPREGKGVAREDQHEVTKIRRHEGYQSIGQTGGPGGPQAGRGIEGGRGDMGAPERAPVGKFMASDGMRPPTPTAQGSKGPAAQWTGAPITQPPNNPITQRPNDPVTQQPNDPITQQPNDPTTQLSRSPLGGVLTSPTTRREGIVANTDVAPTIAAYLGVGSDPTMVGRPMEARPIGAAGATLDGLHGRLVAVEVQRRNVLRRVLNTWRWGMVLLSLWVLFAGYRGVTRLALFPALALIALPVAILSGGALPALSLPVFSLYLAALTLALAWLAWWLGRRTRWALAGPLLLSLCLVAGTIYDGLHGFYAMPYTILSYSVMEGARYYGIGNEFMGCLIAAALMAGGALVTARRGPGRWAALALFGLTALVLAGPSWGAKFGGAITASLAFSFALLRFWDRPITRRLLFWCGLSLVVVVGLVVAADLARGAQSSHVGRLVHAVRELGIGELFLVFQRKWQVNYRLLIFSPWSRLMQLALAPCALYYWRDTLRTKLPAWVRPPSGSGWPSGAEGIALAAILLAALIAFLVNDAGVLAAATALIYVPVGLVAVEWSQTEREQGPP